MNIILNFISENYTPAITCKYKDIIHFDSMLLTNVCVYNYTREVVITAVPDRIFKSSFPQNLNGIR